MSPGEEDDELRDFFQDGKAEPEFESTNGAAPGKAEAPEGADVSHRAESGAGSLLSRPGSLALQKLLSKGVLLLKQFPEEYNRLMVEQAKIRQVLDTMGLGVEINSDYGMAVLMRNADLEEDISDGEGPEDEEGGSALVRASRLTLLQSLVLLVLREYWREREQAGDQTIIIDIETIKDRLKPYWPGLNSEARSDRRMNGAIKKMSDHGILMNVRGKESQKEISPAVVIALGKDEFPKLLEEYRRWVNSFHGDVPADGRNSDE